MPLDQTMLGPHRAVAASTMPCGGQLAASVASLKFLFFSFFLKAKGPMNLSLQEPRSDDDTGESSPND